MLRLLILALLAWSIAALDIGAVPRQLRQATREQVVARLSPRRILAPRASPTPCVGDGFGNCCPTERINTSGQSCCSTGFTYTSGDSRCCVNYQVYDDCGGLRCCVDGASYILNAGTERECCPSPSVIVMDKSTTPQRQFCCASDRVYIQDGAPTCCFYGSNLEHGVCCQTSVVLDPDTNTYVCSSPPPITANTERRQLHDRSLPRMSSQSFSNDLLTSDPFISSANGLDDTFIADDQAQLKSTLITPRLAMQPHGHRHLLSPELLVDYLLNEGSFEHDGELMQDPFAVRNSEVAWKRMLIGATNAFLPHAMGPAMSHVQKMIEAEEPIFLSPLYGFSIHDLPEIQARLAATDYEHINHKGFRFTRQMVDDLAALHPRFNASLVNEYRK